MTEAELMAAIHHLVSIGGLYAQHAPDSRRGWCKGWVDLVIVGSRILYRECKSEYGRLSRDQLRVARILSDAGADYAVWRPSDLLDGTIVRELDRIKLVSRALGHQAPGALAVDDPCATARDHQEAAGVA